MDKYGIEIQLTEEDARLLQLYVSQIRPPGYYLEIGVHQGGSALMVLAALPEWAVAYGIDPEDKNKFHHSRFNFILNKSLEAEKDFVYPVGVLFIDGNHDEAKQDFLAWEKHVIPGGVILFHDYAFHSQKVIDDCNELFLENKKYTILNRPRVITGQHEDTSLFIVRKNAAGDATR